MKSRPSRSTWKARSTRFSRGSRALSTLGPPIIFEVLANVAADGFSDVPARLAKAHSDRANILNAYLTSLRYQIHVLGEPGEDREIHAFDLDDPAKIFGTNYVATKE